MTELGRWTVMAGSEPRVCIGLVLPVDRMERVRLKSRIAAERPPQSIEIVATGGGVEVISGAQHSGPQEVFELPAPPGGVVIDGLIAGRGFHWQHSTSQHIPGLIRARQMDGVLLVTTMLRLEEYLAGVITSEMSGSCPIEFLKSQCVVARSWTLAHTERKHGDLGIDYCNDDCCQRYQGVSGITPAARRAVLETCGQVLLAGDSVVDANYSKSCGGIVESPRTVFGVDKPGLAALVDAVTGSAIERFFPVSEANVDEFVCGEWLNRCDAYCSSAYVSDGDVSKYLGRVDRGEALFRWEVTHSRQELEQIMRRKGYLPADLAELTDVGVAERGASGRAVAMNVTYLDRSGAQATTTIRDQYNIRNALHDRFLYSSAFVVRIGRDDRGCISTVTLVGAGWGHGAGMCQIGALGMALAGCSHEEILGHYFPGARVAEVYSPH